jgi:hypothetical protein
MLPYRCTTLICGRLSWVSYVSQKDTPLLIVTGGRWCISIVCSRITLAGASLDLHSLSLGQSAPVNLNYLQISTAHGSLHKPLKTRGNNEGWRVQVI